MTYGEPEPLDGGVVNMCDEPESPNEGACFRCMIYRNRQIRGRV